MDKAKPLPIFLASLVILLSLTSLLLFTRNQNLKKNNHSLLEDSKKLSQSLENAESANKELLGKQNKGEKTLRDSFDTLRKENESLKLAIKKAEIQTSSAVEEKSYLEEMLINKTKEIELLKNSPSPASVASASSADAQELMRKIRQKDEEITKLGEQNKILSDKLAQLYKTTSDKIAEINVAKIALEETVANARKKIDEEWNTVNLGSITVDKKAAPVATAPVKQESHDVSKKNGRVLATNEEHGFVVVDMGKADDLNSNAVLTVTQDGQPVATLSVLEVRDVMSACNIKDLQDGKKIKINDLVLIQR